MASRPSLALPLMLLLAAPAAADPFAQPVKDCHPCRFSPGPGQPAFDLSFVFQGTGDARVLAGLDIVPAGGGPHPDAGQRLDAGGLAVADFPDGFILDQPHLAPGGPADLSIITQVFADNSNAVYWIYQPRTRRFVKLERVNDDGIQTVLTAGPHGLYSHVHGSMIEYATYQYRLAGNHAVAVRKDSREIDGNFIVDLSYDLTGRATRVISRDIVGFSGDSPARAAFLRRLDAASARAAALYRRGDPAAAAAAVAAVVVGDMQLALLTGSYPVTDDPGDLALARQFNDYGFYLAQAGRPVPAVAVLSQVTDAAPGRVIAYLNLADAQYAAGRMADAKASYAEYRTRMQAAGKGADMPSRVADRLR